MQSNHSLALPPSPKQKFFQPLLRFNKYKTPLRSVVRKTDPNKLQALNVYIKGAKPQNAKKVQERSVQPVQ